MTMFSEQFWTSLLRTVFGLRPRPVNLSPIGCGKLKE